MTFFKQLSAVTRMGFSSLPSRTGSSLVVVIGMACAVGALLSVLSLSTGIMNVLNKGRQDRAIVLSQGQQYEGGSTISRANANIIADTPGVKKTASGRPAASPTVLAGVSAPKKSDGLNTGLQVRGVGPDVLALRPEMKIIRGRMFQPGKFEVIVGKTTPILYQKMDIGDRVDLPQGEWKIVGVFDSGGDFLESAIFTDAQTLASSMRQTDYKSVTVMLESPEALDRFRRGLSANPALQVEVTREPAYWARIGAEVNLVFKAIAYVVGGIMGLGAMFGAINTMYAAVSNRRVEIATLRAIGFGGTAVVFSVLAEALSLALIGALIGACFAWGYFSGNLQSFGGVGIVLSVTPAMAAGGVGFAFVLASLGALFPALRAARQPIAIALESDMTEHKPSLDALRIDRKTKAPRSAMPLVLGLVALILLGGAGAAAYVYWPKPAVSVRAAIAEARGDVGAAGGLDATGYVVARRMATISAKVGGRLAQLNVEEGQRIEKGVVVARLDDSNYAAALRQSQARARLARIALEDAKPIYERYERLNAQGAISTDALERQRMSYNAARATLDVAEADLAVAAVNLNDTIVRAPFSGIITARPAQVGEIVAPSMGGGSIRTGIATIVDMDTLEVEVDVSENYIDRVKPAGAATIVLDAYSDLEISAAVIAVIPTADRSKGTMKVRVAIRQKDPRILPEMGARVSFAIAADGARPTPKGVAVSREAVKDNGRTGTVLVIRDDETLEQREVTLGAKSQSSIVLMAGVSAGERLVTGDTSALKPGMRVKVEE